MAERPSRGLRTLVAGCLAVVLAVGVAACAPASGTNTAGPDTAPSSPAQPDTAGPATPARAAPAPIRVLQLNLCSSGIAGCYTGRSTERAAAVIRAEVPDLVTLNEACQDDVADLERALADAVPGATVVSAFQAARDGRTGEPYRCRNGRQYGIGLLSRWPSVPGSAGNSGIYPAQDRDDPEERAWLCLDAAADPPVAVCTTHLAYTKREVAGAQCRYLFETVIGGIRTRDGAAPVVLGGDLNLGSGDDPDLKACLPPGSALVDDGGQQHVISTPEYAVDDHRTIDLRGTTDHPGLLVTLAPATS
jgi:endonuclease/exonuclease/phosphatase family metal-dependent hydrolase